MLSNSLPRKNELGVTLTIYIRPTRHSTEIAISPRQRFYGVTDLLVQIKVAKDAAFWTYSVCWSFLDIFLFYG